jgi:hypothetical protein
MGHYISCISRKIPQPHTDNMADNTENLKLQHQELADTNCARALVDLLPTKDLLNISGLDEGFFAWTGIEFDQSQKRARHANERMISANLTRLNEEELPLHLRASWRHEKLECDIADLLSALPSTSNPVDSYARLSGAIVGLRWQFADTRKRSLSI